MENTNNIIGRRINSALELRDKRQKELAEYLGVKPNVISYFCKGERVPNIEQIRKMAEFFDVSADYILGLSDVSSTNPNIKTACEVTGLSEDSLNILSDILKNNDDNEHEILKKQDIINEIIKQPIFKPFVESMVQMIRDADAYRQVSIQEFEDEKDSLSYHWSNNYILSKYLSSDAFNHLCESSITNITGYNHYDLYCESLMDLRYFRRKCNGEHNPSEE